MANADNPNGFTPVRHLAGGTIRMEELPLASGTAAAIFSGDMVVLNAGKVEQAAAASTALVGVFAGCQYTAPDGEIKFSTYWPAGATTLGAADAIAHVYTDPDIVFAAQTAGTAALAANGTAQDLIDTDGSTVTGRSAMEVDETTNTTGVLRQIGLVEKADNDWGANGEIEVIIAKHAYRA